MMDARLVPRRFVDLSHPIDAGTQVYPGDPAVSLRPAATIAHDGFNLMHVSMGSQTGTHVDAPFHFFEDGARIGELDVGLFVGHATIVDVRHLPPRSVIEWDHLAPHAHALVPGRILLLHTGWYRYWKTPTYHDHPFLSAGAAAGIVEAGVRTVAVDAMSVDETPASGQEPGGYPAHRSILGAGGAIVENLTDIESIDFPDPVLSVLPIRLEDADGAPVRAVAMELAHGLDQRGVMARVISSAK